MRVAEGQMRSGQAAQSEPLQFCDHEMTLTIDIPFRFAQQ